MKRKRSSKATRRQGRTNDTTARAFISARLEAMVDAMTTAAVIAGRACPCKGKTKLAAAVRSLPRQIAALQRARMMLEPGVPVGRSLRVAAGAVEALMPLLYERPEGLSTVIARAPIVRSAIVASMGPAPLILAELTPANIDALIQALYALARALEEAALDASPEDANALRLLAGRLALLIAWLRSGATLAQIQAAFAALIEDILALLTRLPPTVARVVGAALTDLIGLLTRLAAGSLSVFWQVLLAAAVFILAHLATRWVLEHCHYQGDRLWDLLDENPVFDWWYGVTDANLSRCDKLWRAYLSYRRERRAAQAAGEDRDLVSILAGAEARVLAIWILECVDDSQKPSWERELARVRALI